MRQPPRAVKLRLEVSSGGRFEVVKRVPPANSIRSHAAKLVVGNPSNYNRLKTAAVHAFSFPCHEYRDKIESVLKIATQPTSADFARHDFPDEHSRAPDLRLGKRIPVLFTRCASNPDADVPASLLQQSGWMLLRWNCVRKQQEQGQSEASHAAG